MIIDFFYNGHMLKEINKTFITLIHESKNHFKRQITLNQISLCNVCYKIITKILANRVKHLLNKVVSLLQGAFACFG